MRTAYVYNFLIEANIMASIAILLMIVLRKFLRRSLGNSCICFGWLLVAIRLLLPLSFTNPVINTIRPPMMEDAAIRPIAGQILVRTRDTLSGAVRLLERAGNRTGALKLDRFIDGFYFGTASLALFRVYLLGLALVVAWFIFSNVRFRVKIRAGRIEAISGKLLEDYLALCKERNVKPVPVYYTDPLPSACLLGVFRPYIALPLTASPTDVIHVLTHEICHLKNRDHLWAMLRLVCCALHWFNPLVWIAAAMSRTDSELRCDDRVVAPMSQEQKQSYANVLVLAASRRNAPGVAVLATGMTMTGKRLKERVLTVLSGAKSVRWLSITFIVVASMCLVGAFATSEPAGTIRVSGFAEHYVVDEVQSRVNVKSKEENLECAVKVATKLYPGKIVSQRIEPYIPAKNEYSVYLTYEDGQELWMLITGGIIYELYFSQPTVDHDKYITANVSSPGGTIVTQAEEYAKKLTEELAPGISRYISGWIYSSGYETDDGMIVLVLGINDYDAPVCVTVSVSTDGAVCPISVTMCGNG